MNAEIRELENWTQLKRPRRKQMQQGTFGKRFCFLQQIEKQS